MQSLVAHILASAAKNMWEKDSTLGRYTRETAEHELNLAFHFAAELRVWFPWLDCDFDVTKPNFNRERPDIILHRRQRQKLNFLVVEVKRHKYRQAADVDLEQIRNVWFTGNLCYRFGASVILNEEGQSFDGHLLSRGKSVVEPISIANVLQPAKPPKIDEDLLLSVGELADAVANEREAEGLLDEKIRQIYKTS